MVQVLKDFGFESLGLKEDNFLKENYVTQLVYPPLRIDILNTISVVDFDAAYKGTIIGEHEDLDIFFINITDFIANKLAIGRMKDLGDIESLKKKMISSHLAFNLIN